MVKTAYISEHKVQVCVDNTFFCETVHDEDIGTALNSEFNKEDPYVAKYRILHCDKDKGKCIMLNYKTNGYNGGKYSVLDYIKGSMIVSNKKVKYYAFHFSGYDYDDLISVGEEKKEGDLSKYTWCVEHIIGDTTKKINDLSELAKKIKNKYIKKNKKIN
jgi:hypothetical protein